MFRGSSTSTHNKHERARRYKTKEPPKDMAKICSITGKPYEGYGNNAYPFPGRCCDEANIRYVIPARMMNVTPEMVKEWGVAVICRAIDDKLNAA